MLERVTSRGLNGNEIVKCEYGGKEGWIKIYENIMSLVLQIGPKAFNPNMDFGLHYITNSFNYYPKFLQTIPYSLG